MGMSASQARLLSLQARQSNLEYQGQQINQERTILSQQCTALYNSLLAMTVPTPPSTNDYTTVQYSGVNGATNFTIGTVKPSGDAYNVEIMTTQTGDSIDSSYGSYAVSTANDKIYLTEADSSTMVGTGNYNAGGETAPEGNEPYMKLATNADLQEGDTVYTIDSASGSFQKASYDPETMSDQTLYIYSTDGEYNADTDKTVGEEIKAPKGKTIKDPTAYYIYDGSTYRQTTADDFDDNGDGTYSFKTGNDVKYYETTANESNISIDNPNAGATTVGGNILYTFAQAQELYPNMSWGRYENAIKNKFGQNSDSQYNLTTEDFMVYFDLSESGVPTPHFVLETDVTDNDGFATSYDYTANGTYTVAQATDGCKLEFDAQGRITSISIPTYNTDGSIRSYTEIALTAETVTDEAAYQDAYNEYEYDQYLYDKEQQEINAKTSIIQQEDRNLELKLQRLDNERTQITTEIEAVDKVINDNIEASYKTFSG